MVTISVQRQAERLNYGPAVGLAAQLTLFGAIAAESGLGAAGWVAGLAYAVAVCGTLTLAMRRRAARTLGPANQVTLARAVLVGAVTALVAESFQRPVPVAALVTVAAVALCLDAVDGRVARRTGSTSALGARFDMEIDAVLVLVLSVYVGLLADRPLGAWVLAIGAFRYAFVAASFALPWLRGALPHRMSRKVVAATQGIVLVVAASGLLPVPVAATVVALALAWLCWSFGRDIGLLWRARPAAVTHSRSWMGRSRGTAPRSRRSPSPSMAGPSPAER